MKQCSDYLFFETLATKLRVNIIEALKNGSKSVGELCKIVKEDQSKVSHNLKRLKDCHFINVRKEGKKRLYSLNKESMVPLLKLVDMHIKKYCYVFCQTKKARCLK